MRKVVVTPPSFPEVEFNTPLPWPKDERWKVLCGDDGHWRVGIYSPPETKAQELPELERHTCPELFMLMQGKLTLLIADGDRVREQPLELGVPVLVTAPHAGFCPDGPHTGVAFVVERDVFETEYRSPEEWTQGG